MNYIKALIISIMGFFALLIQVIILAPTFFKMGEALNSTAYRHLGATQITKWASKYDLGRNVFWALVFMILAGIFMTLYIYAQRKEYQVIYR